MAGGLYNNVTGAYLGDAASSVGNFIGTSNDPTKPAVYNPFSLPAIDQNGLYKGQTDALMEVLNRAMGGLNTTSGGLESGVLSIALPGLFNRIGQQTVADVEIPEQIRQKRVADSTAVFKLIAEALGQKSEGSGNRNYESSGFNFGASFGTDPMNPAQTQTHGEYGV